MGVFYRLVIVGVLVSCGGSASPALDATCDPADVRAAVARGQSLMRAKDFGPANAQFERACGCHDAEGCVPLAWSYLSGNGVASDPERAAHLFEQTCGSGPVRSDSVAVACYMFGTLAQTGRGATRPPAAVLALFRRACDGGLSDACSAVGQMLENGIGAPRDAAAALAEYTRSCDGRDAQGCLELSRVFERGELGTRRDPARAAELKVRACELCARNQYCSFRSRCPDQPAPPR